MNAPSNDKKPTSLFQLKSPQSPSPPTTTNASEG